MSIKIPLTQGQHALIDEPDLRLTNGWSWYAAWHHSGWRVQAHMRASEPVVLMHNLIMGCKYVRHLNGNGLDCRRANLTVVDRSQLKASERLRFDNQSGYRGVSRYVKTGSWRAGIGYHGRLYHLGYYDTPQQAALAYDLAASLLYGEHASLNYPIEAA